MTSAQNQDHSSGNSRRWRPTVSVVLVVLTGILLAATLLSGFVRTELIDANRFADRTVEAVIDSPGRDRLAEDLTDDVIATSDSDLVGLRPLIQAAVREVIGSPPFKRLLRSTAVDLHQTVVGGHTDTTTVLISDVGVLVSAALREAKPGVSRMVHKDLDSRLTIGSLPQELTGSIGRAQDLSSLFWPLLFATVIASALALLTDTSRRRAAKRLAMAAIAAGLIVTAISYLFQSELTATLPGGLTHDLLEPVVQSFATKLRNAGLAVALIGVILTAAFRAWVRPLDLGARLTGAWDSVTRPAGSPAGEALRALVLILVGALLIWGRLWIWQVILILAGVVLAMLGLEQLFRLISPEEPDGESTAAEKPKNRRRRNVLLTAVAGIGAFAVFGGGLFAAGTITPPSAFSSGRCNGHAELCDRTVDRVAFATTHNSMSGADVPGYMFAQQERGIPGQLKDGIRSLMIDAHFGRKAGRGVRTEMDGGEINQELQRLFGVDGTAAAERIRDRLVGGGSLGPKEVWLCHGICEVGATLMRSSFTAIRDFLVQNPDEVLVISIQDEAVPPTAIASEFRKSGLLEYVYRESIKDGFPTLKEMVDSNHRVLVFAENDHDPAIKWYHRAFASMKETPYHATTPDQLSCRANRGPENAPLFLINNWIDSTPAPRPSNARIVNSNPRLWDRVSKCAKQRDAFPNFVAVDFYRQGDLFKVIDKLNEVD